MTRKKRKPSRNVALGMCAVQLLAPATTNIQSSAVDLQSIDPSEEVPIPDYNFINVQESVFGRNGRRKTKYVEIEKETSGLTIFSTVSSIVVGLGVVYAVIAQGYRGVTGRDFYFLDGWLATPGRQRSQSQPPACREPKPCCARKLSSAPPACVHIQAPETKVRHTSCTHIHCQNPSPPRPTYRKVFRFCYFFILFFVEIPNGFLMKLSMLLSNNFFQCAVAVCVKAATNESLAILTAFHFLRLSQQTWHFDFGASGDFVSDKRVESFLISSVLTGPDSSDLSSTFLARINDS
eukprot:GHVP01035493.1.p1 GENE.GHVP01035493.1~~GHVP01035493.1.p1  ORF type:complete len:293 (-),score=39.50 GHVP01035493.1:812-1690(-)